MMSLFVFGAFLNIVENIIDGFFRVVASYRTLNICQEFCIMFNGLEELANPINRNEESHLVVLFQLEFKLDSLL